MTEKDKKTEEMQDKKFDPTCNLPKDENGKIKGGPGRPKGMPNKATKDKREWVSKLLEDREDLIEEALDNLAQEDPDKALKHLLGLLEYTTPKLARSEITGADNGPVELFMVNRLKDPEAEDDDEE
jgi:hypothetical protein